MTGKSCRIRHDHAVTYPAVMSNVRLGHDETVVSNLRQHSAAAGTTVNGHKFSDLIPLTNSRL
jgi:hypothetical protein